MQRAYLHQTFNEHPTTHAVVTFPEFDEETRAQLETLRRNHDPLAWRIAAHIEIIAPTTQSQAQLRHLLERVAEHAAAFPLLLRRAVAVQPPAPQRAEVWLIPDTGNSDLLQLHDQVLLDTGTRSLFDPRYYPHVTIAAHDDIAQCTRIAQQMNDSGRRFSGLITALDLVTLRPQWVDRTATFSLSAPTEPVALVEPADLTPVTPPVPLPNWPIPQPPRAQAPASRS